MPTQPLKILIVSEDRKQLRHLSKFLNTFGYETQQVADPHHVSLLLKTDVPDFMILDAGSNLSQAFSLCRIASGSEDAPCPYTLLLIESPQVRDLSTGLQVGVDDFLAKPFNYGEILARLRAGARRREFERRFREQTGIDARSGLPNAGVFRRRLHSAVAASNGSGVCILLEIDFHAQLSAEHEWTVGRDILKEVAEKLRQCCRDGDLAAALGHGRFGVFLADVSENDARTLADRIAYALNEIEFECGEEKHRITISSGVCAFAAGLGFDAEGIMKKADDALQVAKRSGYNFTADPSECEAEAKAWAELAAPGVLFEHTTAGDIMTPCTLTLHPDDMLAQAQHIFHHLNTAFLPVVNPKGMLQGVLAAETLAENESSENVRVHDLMTHDFKRFEESESLENLKQFFANDPRQYAVIVRQSRPTGWITPNNLIALGTFLNTETFQSEDISVNGCRHLQVADI
jgi:diguanylate cyclase (GGDEF)-like protein